MLDGIFFLDMLPYCQGFELLLTGQWKVYAQNLHFFGTFQGAGTAILL